ncbi:hypothetical protein JCM19037_4270 [Geomicrobium sp. JCM 19037]|uniref:DUF1048 domain-containing protein n=1 Tax=Geomicrobium sp. JCM 19037 TaxID=1460634 RepID=UPI00045F3433|nr:DUF1048 domain-containing protein [Geomicrobium sp. JCM 19037]GAK05743.1 hypothetical protein JCM19037_4270 [Geomicrobium sp. JCM 19037]
MSTKQIITDINERRRKLSEENKKVYDDVLVYIRTLKVKEEPSERALAEILDHLEDAEADGKTAKEVFGDDLPGYCRALVAELPKTSWKHDLLYGGFFAMIVAIFTVASALISSFITNTSVQVSLLTTIIFIVVAFFVALPVILFALRETSFTDSKLKRIGIPFAIGVGIFGFAVLNEWFLGDVFVIELSRMAAVLLLLLLIVGSWMLLSSTRKTGGFS